MAHLGPATSYKYCPQPRTPHSDEQLAGARRLVRSAGPASRHPQPSASPHLSVIQVSPHGHLCCSSPASCRCGVPFLLPLFPAKCSCGAKYLLLLSHARSRMHIGGPQHASIPSPSRLSLLAPDAGARLSHRSQSRARPTSLRTGNTVAFHPSRSDRFCACWC